MSYSTGSYLTEVEKPRGKGMVWKNKQKNWLLVCYLAFVKVLSTSVVHLDYKVPKEGS